MLSINVPATADDEYFKLSQRAGEMYFSSRVYIRSLSMTESRLRIEFEPQEHPHVEGNFSRTVKDILSYEATGMMEYKRSVTANGNALSQTTTLFAHPAEQKGISAEEMSQLLGRGLRGGSPAALFQVMAEKVGVLSAV